MKKVFMLMMFLVVSQLSQGVLVSAVAETGPNRNITNIKATDDSATITIPGAALECTKEFSTKFVTSEADNITFWITATSTVGTPSLTYSFEQSIQATTSASSGTNDSSYLVTDTLYSGASERIQIATVDTVSGTYGRLRIQGGATNPKDTSITIKMVK